MEVRGGVVVRLEERTAELQRTLSQGQRPRVLILYHGLLRMRNPLPLRELCGSRGHVELVWRWGDVT